MRRPLPLLLALVAAAGAGCNRGEVARVEGRVVDLETADYRIAPQRVRVAPGRITFRIRNAGGTPHNWTVARRGRTRARVPTMLPGERETVTVRLRRGTYRMSCSLTHHEVLGEYGTVSVR